MIIKVKNGTLCNQERKKMEGKVKKNLYYGVLLLLSFTLFIFCKQDASCKQDTSLMATMLLGYVTEGILENYYLDLENNNFFNYKFCLIVGLVAVIILFFTNWMYIMLFVAIYFLPFVIGITSFVESRYKDSCKKIMKKGFLRAIIVVILAIIGVTMAHFCPNLKIEEYLTLDYFFSFFFMTIVEILDLIKDFFGIE